MAVNPKTLQTKMGSVQAIQKITRAMKMVSASKLRRAQKSMEIARPIVNKITSDVPDNSKLYQFNDELFKKKTLIIGIFTDRGLCGSINSTTAKKIYEIVGDLEKETSLSQISITTIGEKGKDLLRTSHLRPLLKDIFWKTGKTGLTLAGIQSVTEQILSENYDSCIIVYNKFNSVISFDTLLYPIKKADDESKSHSNETNINNEFNFGQHLSQFHLSTILYDTIVETLANEYGARMSAMDNATSSAGEIIDELRLSYNRSRQATITTELIEIISGATAIEEQG